MFQDKPARLEWRNVSPISSSRFDWRHERGSLCNVQLNDSLKHGCRCGARENKWISDTWEPAIGLRGSCKDIRAANNHTSNVSRVFCTYWRKAGSFGCWGCPCLPLWSSCFTAGWFVCLTPRRRMAAQETSVLGVLAGRDTAPARFAPAAFRVYGKYCPRVLYS